MHSNSNSNRRSLLGLAVIHDYQELGIVLELKVLMTCAFPSTVYERTGEYNILMSGWAAPYFSSGSTGCTEDEVSSLESC